MNKLFKILAQPMDPEELWGPRDGSSYDHWDTGDVISVLVFLAILILVIVLPVAFKYILNHISERRRERRLQEFRKERGIQEWCERRENKS